MTVNFRRGVSSIALSAAIFLAGQAAAQQVIVVPSGTTDTTPKTVGGTDSITVQTGGTLTSTSNPTINWANASTDLRIVNSGTIASTNATGRAINASGGNNVRTVTLTNNAGGVITSADDAFRINVAPTGGTITVNNFGVIRTTGGGQALDFDAVAGGATVVINNAAGAELRSFGQDAIRPGQGATVTNAGLIFSDGAANNSFDGIDWQARSGTVVNQATGTISGLRHGITSDVAVNVTNAGTIVGRNGSGIGSDGAGTVVNTGTITGQWDGVATNGDGDGVDIDFIGSVTNSGTIQGLSAAGVDSGGRPNSAEGVAMGGGTIVNNAGALIFGAGNAVLVNHDTNPGGVADAATTVTNTGTIRATTGRAIQFVGAFADTITNSGTITGGAAGAIDMGDGNDTLNLQTGSVITGTVDGGVGTDTVNLGGTGNGTFAGAVNFERLAIASGNWTLTGNSIFSGGTAVTANATLIGTSATLLGPIANSGALVIDQATDGTFSATLTGTGRLVKSGAGALTLGNQTAFTGPTTVSAGRLVLAGTLPSAVTVASGGTLAGIGTITGLSVASGGIVAPGNSPGTITVTGNYLAAAGSSYQAETTAAGASDLIAVGGTATIAAGAQLAATRDAGTYTLGQRYTVLTAAGGVAGSYTLTQAVGGTTEFRLGQSAGAVFLDVVRTGASLAAAGQTPNQRGVAPAVAALGVANPIYLALTAVADDTALQAGLDSLSGEVHASVRTAAVIEAGAAQDIVSGRIGMTAEGPSLWMQGVRRGGNEESVAGSASARRKGWGTFGGIDFGLGDTFRAGIAGGYVDTDLAVSRRASSATVKTTHALAYLGGSFGGITLRGGLGYAWVKNAVARNVAFTGFQNAVAARYDGKMLHGFVEAGAELPFAQGKIEPFAGLAAFRVTSDAFAETGGAAALVGTASKQTFTQGRLGLRGSTPIVEDLAARASVAWEHQFSNRQNAALLRFAGGGVPFTVTGTALSRDAAALALDLEWRPGQGNLCVTAGYGGMIGGYNSDSNLRLGLSIIF